MASAARPCASSNVSVKSQETLPAQPTPVVIRGRVRTATLVLLFWLPAGAGDKTQIAWVGDWEEAFEQARKTSRPVMVCINSKDGETANETTAKKIYRDPLFVTLTRKFIMVLVSTRAHSQDGVCPRFGKVTCKQHLDCWKELRANHGERFVIRGSRGAMISPQHAWFRPGGTLLRRKEYFLDKGALLKRMRAVLAATRNPTDPGDDAGGSPEKDAPLNEGDRAELARLGKADKETRRTALANLLATEKTTVHGALIELLRRTRNVELRCSILRALAGAHVVSVRPAAEELLKHKHALVRSFAAVTLEELGSKESIGPLMKRIRSEQDKTARKNMLRALGVVGGAASDKAAARLLLKAVTNEKQKMLRKHAALALRGFRGKATRLVLKRIEQMVLRVKGIEVKKALISVLAFIGEPQTTRPVLEKVLGEMRLDYDRQFVEGAIRALGGKSKGFSTSWLYWEDRNDPARKG